MWHGIRCSVQPELVRAFLCIPPSLVDADEHEKKVHRKERGKRTVPPRPSRIMHLTVGGDFCNIHEPVELCPAKLACNTLADVLRSHTLWLPVT